MAYSVYGIFCEPENKMVYVGMTSRDVYARLYEHTYRSGVLHGLCEKYGFDALKPIILETDIETREKALEIEERYTRYYDSISPLYNKGFGKISTERISKEVMRERYEKTLRLWQKEHGNWCKGKHLPPEMAERLRTMNIGRVHSEETRKHMSEASGVAKPVYCHNNNKKYSSAQKAAEDLGLDPSSVIKTAKGQYKHTKGYKFDYPPVEPPWKITI